MGQKREPTMEPLFYSEDLANAADVNEFVQNLLREVQQKKTEEERTEAHHPPSVLCQHAPPPPPHHHQHHHQHQQQQQQPQSTQVATNSFEIHEDFRVGKHGATRCTTAATAATKAKGKQRKGEPNKRKTPKDKTPSGKKGGKASSALQNEWQRDTVLYSPLTPPEDDQGRASQSNTLLDHLLPYPATSSTPPARPNIKMEPPQTPPSPPFSSEMKIKLRNTIETRRRNEGKKDIDEDLFPEKKPSPLTKQEKRKREKRRRQNCVAARRCREKKKLQAEQAEQIVADMLQRNKELEEEIGTLKEYLTKILTFLLQHQESGCCILLQTPSTPSEASTILNSALDPTATVEVPQTIVVEDASLPSPTSHSGQASGYCQQQHQAVETRPILSTNSDMNCRKRPNPRPTPDHAIVSPPTTPPKRARKTSSQIVPCLSPNWLSSSGSPLAFSPGCNMTNSKDTVPSMSTTADHNFPDSVSRGFQQSFCSNKPPFCQAITPAVSTNTTSNTPRNLRANPTLQGSFSSQQVEEPSTGFTQEPTPDPTAPSRPLPSWDLAVLQPSGGFPELSQEEMQNLISAECFENTGSLHDAITTKQNGTSTGNDISNESLFALQTPSAASTFMGSPGVLTSSVNDGSPQTWPHSTMTTPEFQCVSPNQVQPCHLGQSRVFSKGSNNNSNINSNFSHRVNSHGFQSCGQGFASVNTYMNINNGNNNNNNNNSHNNNNNNWYYHDNNNFVKANPINSTTTTRSFTIMSNNSFTTVCPNTNKTSNISKNSNYNTSRNFRGQGSNPLLVGRSQPYPTADQLNMPDIYVTSSRP